MTVLLRRLQHILAALLTPLLVACQVGDVAEITVKVYPPRGPSFRDSVFIAGNSTLLGDWNPAAVVMGHEVDSVRVFRWNARPGEVIELKITRGSWAAQAVFEEGKIPENIRFKVLRDTVLVLRPVAWADQGSFQGGMSGISGTARYHRDLTGEGLRHPRDVVVWLPPSYEQEQAKRYPVLYMHDGQNVFDPGTSFLGYDWRIDEVADSLIRQGAIEEIIVVGIANTPDRVPEYSDTERGRAYARFVAKTLKPMIDSLYRTKPGPQHTAVMGSSMGGLISFLFVWWYPDVFSGAGCLSSAFSVDGGKILREVERDRGPRKPLRIYLDCGTEDLEARLKPGYELMAELLRKKGYQQGVDLEYFLDEGATHNEQAWAARVWRPLTFLFGTSPHSGR